MNGDLSQDEIRERLRLVNPELAKELYEIAKSQTQLEVGRQSRLDSKATSIITAAGLSMAVASSLGGIIASGNVTLPRWLLWTFTVTAFVGLAAVIMASVAFMVSKGFGRVNENAVFDTDVLQRSDEPTGCDDLASAGEKLAYGTAIYRQYMTAHLWELYVRDKAELDRKAKKVFFAQWLFVAFLVLLLACELLLFRELSSHSNARKTASPNSAAPEGEVRRQRADSSAPA